MAGMLPHAARCYSPTKVPSHVVLSPGSQKKTGGTKDSYLPFRGGPANPPIKLSPDKKLTTPKKEHDGSCSYIG